MDKIVSLAPPSGQTFCHGEALGSCTPTFFNFLELQLIKTF
jgi:hypothetical protein